MSLPQIFGTRLETIPYPDRYLQAEAAAIARWQARTARPGAKIGLVWAGGERPAITWARRNDTNRSITLHHYAPILAVEGAHFFSLQKGSAAAQTSGIEIHDCTDELADFAETAALVETLDLVITVDTAVAHLAAALGKPVWILLPWTPCWRWLERRTDSPWYANVRLFRQAEHRNWDSVLGEVAAELRKLVGPV